MPEAVSDWHMKTVKTWFNLLVADICDADIQGVLKGSDDGV
jgi:hypothetical protein